MRASHPGLRSGLTQFSRGLNECFHPHPRIKYGAGSNLSPVSEYGAGSEGEGVCRLVFTFARVFTYSCQT